MTGDWFLPLPPGSGESGGLHIYARSRRDPGPGGLGARVMLCLLCPFGFCCSWESFSRSFFFLSIPFLPLSSSIPSTLFRLPVYSSLERVT